MPSSHVRPHSQSDSRRSPSCPLISIPFPSRFSFFRAFAFSIGSLSAVATGLLAGCRPAVTRSAAPIRFDEVTQQAGIRFERFNGAFGRRWMPETMGGGGGFIDYDGDGCPDIVRVNGDWWP